MALQRVKTGVIGCGVISRYYLDHIAKFFHVLELTACADLIPERAQEAARAYGMKAVTDEELLADPDIRIVLNLTYPTAHYAVTRAALLAGKNVYTEKMLAVTFEEGRELVDLAREKGLLLTAAPDTFLGGGWQTARHLVDGGAIGEPVSVSGVCVRQYANNGEDLPPYKSMVLTYGGGIPFDMGGYYLHNMINLLGPLTRVTGFMRTRNAQRTYENPRNPLYGEPYVVDSPNMIAAALEFKCGAYGTLMVHSESSTGAKPFFEITGTQGVLTLFDPNDFCGEMLLSRSGTCTFSPEGWRVCQPRPVPPLYPFTDNSRGVGAAEMAYSLQAGRKPRADAAMGLHALEAVHGVWESCRTGKTHVMTTTCERPRPLNPGDQCDSMQEVALMA